MRKNDDLNTTKSLIMKRFILLIGLTFFAAMNFAGATIYYSISGGIWDDNNNWSTTGFGGAAAGAYPVAGDSAYIQGYEIEVNNANMACAYVQLLGSGSNDGKLEIEDGYSLTVAGDMLLDANGGSREAHLHLEENSGGMGGGILTVQGDFLAYRNGGSDVIKIKVNDNSIMRVNGDMTLDSDGGTKRISLSVKDDGQLIVDGDLTMDYSGGSQDVYGKFEDNSFLDVSGDIYITASAQSRVVFKVLDDTRINLAGDVIRQATPNNYGLFDMQDNSTITFDASIAQVIGEDEGAGTDGFTYENVTINNSYGTSPQLTLEGDVTVNGTLTMSDGVIKVGADDLIIATSGTTAGGSINSYVDVTSSNGGKMVKLFNNNSSIDFLVGDVNEYSPFTFTKNSSSGGTATITCNITDGLHPNLDPGDLITRYWTIDASGIGSIDYDVSYIYNEVDVTGTEATLNTARWNGVAWTQYNNVNTVTNTLTSSSGISEIPSNHDFSAGNGMALPIELLDMGAEVVGRSVEINWTSSVEINNDYYTVERSNDGINFEVIAEVEGMGTSYTENNYSYIDNTPLSGTSYYRLKQTDYDQRFEYFDPVAVQITNTTSTMKIYPNPLLTGQELTLEISDKKANEEVLVVLYNHTGQQVYSKVMITESNGVLTGIDLMNNLAPGVYLIVASSKNEICQQKLVISGGNGSSNYARN